MVRNALQLCVGTAVVCLALVGDALAQGRMPAINDLRSVDAAAKRLGVPGRPETAEGGEGFSSGDADQIDPALLKLREKVRRALALYYPRKLNSREHNPWEVMHQIIAYGVNTKILQGGPNGEPVNAIAYVCWNNPCAGKRLLELRGDRLNAAKGPQVQGHHGQFVGMLAQSRVPIDYPMRSGDREFTVADLVETEKLTCRSGEELTFKLIAISHYCDLDVTWKNDQGQTWDIPRLLREEIAAPVKKMSTCGGSHRLFSVAYPVRKLIKKGDPIEGEFRRAQVHTQNYIKWALKLQNSDGSMSTEWFERRGSDPDLDRRIKTSGHILEWLAFAIDDEQVGNPKVMKGFNYLSTMLLENRKRQWEIGPVGHALHALSIYDERITNLTKYPEGVDEEEPLITQPAQPEAPSSGLELHEALEQAIAEPVEETTEEPTAEVTDEEAPAELPTAETSPEEAPSLELIEPQPPQLRTAERSKKQVRPAAPKAKRRTPRPTVAGPSF